MEFSAGAWWIVGLGVTIAITIIGYFLKRTIGATDEHDKDINDIKRDYLRKCELKEFTDKTDAHEKDINEIKRTYVTKEELTDVKKELREDLAVLQKDIKEIKENSLQKKDFYRTQGATDQKLDKIYDLIIADKGGTQNGK